MSEDFAERFTARYREKVERTKRDYEKKNRKFNAYIAEVTELYRMIEETTGGTPVTLERGEVTVERRMSFFETDAVTLEKLTLKLQNCFISFTPRGIDYDTGAASLTVEHNNIREKPMTIDLFLRSSPESEAPADFTWQIKIGYKNFRPFDRSLLEGLLETIFLS